MIAIVITIVFLVQWIFGGDVTWWGTANSIATGFWDAITNTSTWAQFIILPIFFLFNFLILMGPMMMMGISQIKGFEPGDANWGVKLEDVRGQAEAKEEVRRIVSLWTSGEAFEQAGGRRERGILFHGAPGTGKTMLAKAIATGFNSPFVTIPGSGFAQTFIGVDALIVRYLARKAKRLAAKWGGQCIVFIDEIDAVGMRRASLGSSMTRSTTGRYDDHCFYGPNGSLTPTGDLILETRGWRDRMFEQRDSRPARPYPAWYTKLAGIVNQAFPGGMMGGTGQLALNQLLVTMDGIDNPPFWRRFWTNRLNNFLDATYVVPRRIGNMPLRMPAPRPAEQPDLLHRGDERARSRRSTRRSSARAAWAATSGSGRRRSATARTSSTSISAGSSTTRSSTPSGPATSSPGSPTATLPQWSSRCARWR